MKAAGQLLHCVACLRLPSQNNPLDDTLQLSQLSPVIRPSSCTQALMQTQQYHKAVSPKVTHTQLSHSPQSCGSPKCNMSSSTTPMICTLLQTLPTHGQKFKESQTADCSILLQVQSRSDKLVNLLSRNRLLLLFREKKKDRVSAVKWMCFTCK